MTLPSYLYFLLGVKRTHEVLYLKNQVDNFRNRETKHGQAFSLWHTPGLPTAASSKETEPPLATRVPTIHLSSKISTPTHQESPVREPRTPLSTAVYELYAV